MIQISPTALTFLIGTGFLLLGKWTASAGYYKDLQKPHRFLGWHSEAIAPNPAGEYSQEESYQSEILEDIHAPHDTFARS